jgi:hypothetical protein
MRTLFLDKARPGTRRWVLLVGGLALAEVVFFTAYVLRPAPPDINLTLASPQQRCTTRGEQQLADAGDWPTTQDGRDARLLVQSRCTLDTEAFG